MKKSGLNSIGKNIANSLFRQVLTGLVQLATITIIARFYGPEVNGIYNVVLLLPLLLATFLNLGVTPANVYYISSGQISAQHALAESLKIFSLLFFVGTAIGLFIIFNYSDSFFKGADVKVLYASLLIFPFTMLINLILGVFQGLQIFKVYNLLLLLQPIAILLITLSLFLFEDSNVVSLIASYLLGTIITVIVGFICLKKYSRKKSSTIINYKRKVLTYGYKAHLSNILAFVNYKVDILLVNYFIGPISAGIYVISLQLSERLWIISQSVSVVILPKLSELIDQDDKVNVLTPLMTRWVTFLTLVASLMLGLVCYPLISFLFGDNYLGAVIPLLILLPGTVLASGSRILANDFAAKGRPELNMYTSWLAVVINILGNIILIPVFGITGAAIATTFAYFMNYVMRIYIYRKFTGMSFTSLFIIPTQEFKEIYLYINHKFLSRMPSK